MTLHTVHSVKGGSAHEQMGYLIFKAFTVEASQWVIGIILRPHLDGVNCEHSREQSVKAD
jgi:hypothetical protein